MVEKDDSRLSVRRQCKLLGVNRNRLEPPPPNPSEEDLRILRILDELHMAEPSYGARRLAVVLKRDHGIFVNRKRLRHLMKIGRIAACYPKPRTSIPNPEHARFPYLLKDAVIDAPNQAWCADITYIPMRKGHCFLFAIMDWHSRKVLAWALSTTLDTRFCVEAFHKAVLLEGRAPDIFNTDQGCQFTAREWVQALQSHPGLRISMDGKGRWVDNVFIERLWRSVKYEDVYLKAYETPRDVERGLADWFRRYNDYRPHKSLDGRTPSAVHAELLEQPA